MKKSLWAPVIGLFAVALLGSIVHCSLAAVVGDWRHVLPGLYYIPIVVAGITLGTRATIGVAIVAGLCHAAASALGCGDPWARPFTESILFLCVGVTAARLTHMHEAMRGSRRALSVGPHDESLERVFRSGECLQQMPAFGQIVDGLIRRFRMPVSSIEGAIGLLEDPRFPSEKREDFIRIIRRESHLLERALSDIQEFTQPSRPKYRKVDLSGLLDNVIRLAGPKEHEHFFLFRKEIPSDMPPLQCDAGQITKLLLNLVMNAVQAMPGGGQVTLAARVEPRSAVISVQDAGKGISAPNLERIFDPFFTTRESGIGLGLTVANQIATAHGGRITVEVNSDRGTTVSLLLPLSPPKLNDHGPHTGGRG